MKARRRVVTSGAAPKRRPTVRRIKPAMVLKTVFRPVLELIEIPARFGDADHRHVEMATFQHGL